MFKSVNKVSFAVLRGLITRRIFLDSTRSSIATKDEKLAEDAVELSEDLINHLERTSLVDFGNKEALSRLEEAIKFAEILQEVDTTGIEPMISVLDMDLRMREDEPKVTSKEKILANASLVEEDYFVAPPGNIPLQPHNTNKLKSQD